MEAAPDCEDQAERVNRLEATYLSSYKPRYVPEQMTASPTYTTSVSANPAASANKSIFSPKNV